VNKLRGNILTSELAKRVSVVLCCCKGEYINKTPELSNENTAGFVLGKEVTCDLDKLPNLTKWLSEQTSPSVKEANEDLNVFLKAASNDAVPIKDRRALLNVVQLVEELSRGKYSLSLSILWIFSSLKVFY